MIVETIGSLIDKICIVKLKLYHMNEQIFRIDVGNDHVRSCKEKLRILDQQKDELVNELNLLFKDVILGNKKIKVYRRFKMYNEPKYQIPNSR